MSSGYKNLLDIMFTWSDVLTLNHTGKRTYSWERPFWRYLLLFSFLFKYILNFHFYNILSISRINVLHFNIFTHFKISKLYHARRLDQRKTPWILFYFELYSGNSLKVVNNKTNYIIKKVFWTWLYFKTSNVFTNLFYILTVNMLVIDIDVF